MKKEIVEQDPTEQNLRKTLNFGHTLGHAIESYFMESDQKQRLLHGEAIAIGMVLANYLSTQLCDLEEVVCNELSSAIMSFYQIVDFDDKDIEQIITLLKYDKKNSHGKVLFVLLNNIGDVVLNQEVSNELIYKAFEYYKNLNKN